MHSKDFDYAFDGDHKIEGKTRAQWEEEFGIVGLVASLKKSGWDRYQWRHSPDEEKPRCFAEFFSHAYHGYLRGDGKTVRDAVLQCLATAQKFAKCEQATGHSFDVFNERGAEYTNGLIFCQHCGFNGYTAIFTSLKQQIDDYRIHAQISAERSADEIRFLEEHGKSRVQDMAERLKSAHLNSEKS